MEIEDKLSLNKYKPDIPKYAHLKIIDQETCRRCKTKPCTTFCPAQTYRWENEKLVLSYENCLECGSCRIGCPEENIDWGYPRAGFGISHRYG